MKKAACLTLAALALPLTMSRTGQASDYFPYQSIDSYFNQPPASPNPPATPQAAPGQPPAGQVSPVPPPLQRQAPPQAEPPERQARPKAEPAVPIIKSPEFLFPKELGFGVAVGVPYDLVYISGTYYYWRDGAWRSSPSYRGPWSRLESSRLPPELRQQNLAKIRAARNREFGTFWKNKEGYQGKTFRPGDKEQRGQARELPSPTNLKQPEPKP